ncbi:MAG: hypothetical protein FJ119_14245 [Deltaproteobacteria bacterium]|nr:hypothetical protein [Deltaproteobacteria bacterium]
MIISELFYQEIEQLLKDVEQAIAGTGDVREQMRAFIVQVSRAIVENNDFFKVYVARLTDEAEKPGTTKMITTFFDGYVSRLKAIIEKGIASGVFRQVDAESIARASYSLMVGSIFMKHAMKVDLDLDYQNKTQIDLLLEAIKK